MEEVLAESGHLPQEEKSTKAEAEIRGYLGCEEQGGVGKPARLLKYPLSCTSEGMTRFSGAPKEYYWDFNKPVRLINAHLPDLTAPFFYINLHYRENTISFTTHHKKEAVSSSPAPLPNPMKSAQTQTCLYNVKASR